MEVSIVIPCRNESATLGDLVRRLIAASQSFSKYQILVVDNASSDQSAEIAAAAGAEVIPCSEIGYGAALRHGILHARYETIVMLDADLTYLPEELPRLAKSFELTQAGLLIGDRLQQLKDPKAMPFLNRHLGTPVLSFILRRLFPNLESLRDCNSGYRVFTKTDFVSWNPQSSGMELASEMLVLASLKNSKVMSLPIHFSSSPVARRPHLRPWRDGFRHLAKILELRGKTWLALPLPVKRSEECSEVLQKNLNSVSAVSKTRF